MKNLILDCTLRDGGYINNWRFNEEFLTEYKSKMEKMKIDFIEIGFINKTNKYKDEIVGVSKILSESDIKFFEDYDFKIAVMGDFKDFNMDILKKKLKIDLVRVAFHKYDMKEALDLCVEIKKLGYKVSVNAMAITNYSMEELHNLLDFINNNELDILYLADSYGSLKNNDIKFYIDLFENKLNKNTQIGVHLHNNMNNAYSNYEYIENNYVNKMIDTTIFGMGRGAGNLQTELVVINNNTLNIDNVIDFFNFIQNYIKKIYKLENNVWGYDLDFILSGFHKMHPNYIVCMRDLNISMNNRFFLIQELVKNNCHKYFNKNHINDLIIKNKPLLI